MTDFGGLATAVVSILTVLGGGYAWIVARRDKKKDPIPKQTAALALADQSVSMMQGVAAELRADMLSVRGELAEVKSESDKNKKRVTSLEQTVETLDSSLTAAVRYIERLIRYMRAGAHGPEPTVPAELHGLIDPLLRGWGNDPA